MIPEFSLLICVCANDDEDHFRLALTSVTRDQSLAPTEVVVVIDGPVSQEIHRTVTAVEDSEIVPFKVLEVKKQSGLAFCLNLGLKNCKYKWVARMDADDIALPNRFLMQMGYLKDNPNLAVLGSSVIEFGNVKNERVKTVVTDTEELKRVLKVRNPINHPS